MTAVVEGDQRHTLFELMLNKSPVGLLLLERNRLLIANPAAMQILSLNDKSIGATLTLDGPDGLLTDRVADIVRKDEQQFDYNLPANNVRSERVISVEVISVPNERLLLAIDDVTAERRVEAKWSDSIAHALHDLKTPLAVLTMGLSNLSTYYERMSDEMRREEIDDLAEHVREMSNIFNELFKQMKSISKRATGTHAVSPDDKSPG
jgi:signal transduction histidine kinase